MSNEDTPAPTCADCDHTVPLLAEHCLVACVVVLDYRRKDHPATCGNYRPRPLTSDPGE